MQNQKQPGVIELWNKIAMGDDLRPSLIALKECCKEEALTLVGAASFDGKKLVALLGCEDAKARKNVALLLGILGAAMLGTPAKSIGRSAEAVLEEINCYMDSLVQAYQEEQTLFVRSSYLKALGMLAEAGADCEAILGTLEERRTELENMVAQNEVAPESAKHVTEELRELRAILPTKERRGHIYAEPSRPVRVILTCRKELRGTLLAAMHDINPEETKEMALGVITKTARIDRLAKLRLYQEMLFPLNGMKAIPRQSLVQELCEGNMLPLLGLLHEASEEAYSFRIHVPDTNQSDTGKLDANKLGRQLESYAKGRLINSVSDYEIEIKLIARPEDTYLAFLKLYTKKDTRFAYRKKVVATSMHPVKAAGMVTLVKEYLTPKAQLLDPYCGVGTLLVERNLLVPAANVYGIDTFKDAIDGARENTELAREYLSKDTDIYYIHRDSNDFTSEYLFDEILTEMPRFAKEQADEAYRSFFTHSYGLMKEHGLIIMDSVEKGLVHKYLRLMGNQYRLVRHIPLVERDEENIYIIEKLPN